MGYNLEQSTDYTNNEAEQDRRDRMRRAMEENPRIRAANRIIADNTARAAKMHAVIMEAVAMAENAVIPTADAVKRWRNSLS